MAIQKIIWEKDATGKAAIYKWKNRKNVVPMYSKTIATLKMKDVNYLSASLSGSMIMFYEWIWFLWDYTNYIDFCAIYRNDISSDREEEDSIPYICLRKSRWDQKTDTQSLSKGNDGLDYILSDLQLQSENIFLDSRKSPKIIKLTQEIVNSTKDGFPIKKRERRKTPCEYFEVQIIDDYRHIYFGYIPCNNECQELEFLSDLWRKEFEDLSLTTGLVPDNSLQVSYKLSLWDQIGRIESK